MHMYLVWLGAAEKPACVSHACPASLQSSYLKIHHQESDCNSRKILFTLPCLHTKHFSKSRLPYVLKIHSVIWSALMWKEYTINCNKGKNGREEGKRRKDERTWEERRTLECCTLIDLSKMVELDISTIYYGSGK